MVYEYNSLQKISEMGMQSSPSSLFIFTAVLGSGLDQEIVTGPDYHMGFMIEWGFQPWSPLSSLTLESLPHWNVTGVKCFSHYNRQRVAWIHDEFVLYSLIFLSIVFQQPSYISELGAPGRSSLDNIEMAYARQVSKLESSSADILLQMYCGWTNRLACKVHHEQNLTHGTEVFPHHSHIGKMLLSFENKGSVLLRPVSNGERSRIPCHHTYTNGSTSYSRRKNFACHP